MDHCQRRQSSELNGYDEEVLARTSSKKGVINAELLNIILSRCVESIGQETNVTPDLLDMLYMGDWDALLLGIRVASFGEEVKWAYTCDFCEAQREVSVNLLEDVETRTLGDTTFEYQGRRVRYEVGYPKASVTRELLKLRTPTPADVITETLLGSIISIPGKMIITRNDIRAMPTADREGIIQKVQAGAPAVLLGEVKKSCPGCEEDVYVPLTLAALFQSRVAGI